MPPKALQQEKIFHLDLHEFSAVQSGTPVQEVINQMRRDKHNCAFVLQDGLIVGIFTDRDVLKKIVTQPDSWGQPVDDFMTASPTSIAPDAIAETALQLMEEGHFRNLPVVDGDGKLHGNVSYYAFIKFLADHFPQEIYNLPPDDGIADNRYGG